MNRMVLAQLLKNTKLQIDAVGSGEECLKATVRKYYNLILMDYRMPDMNGAETFSKLKKQESGLCRDVPVVLLTAGDEAGAKQLVEEYGFDSYLEKPIRAERLEAEIVRLLPEELIEYSAKEASLSEQEGGYAARHRRKRKLCITTDCICDLPDEIISQYDIPVMYLYIRTEFGRFKDTREIDSDNITYFFEDERISESMVRSVSVTIGEYEEFFSMALSEAENVIHISMAANAGKSYGVAIAAAKGFDHVKVIDSGQISGGEGLIVLRAAQMAKDGAGAEAIVEEIEKLKHCVETKFVLQNAKTFCRNGYASRLTAQLCELFHIHPVLKMKHSYARISGGYIGNTEHSWKLFCRSLFLNKKAIEPELVYITYVSLSVDQLEMIKKEIQRYYPFERVIVQKASFSNSINAGPYTVGVAFYRKERYLGE
jgi:DegV family protein with EDD domain